MALPIRSKWGLLAFAAIALTVPVLFQNCGKAGFDSSDEALSLSSLTSSDTKLSSAPFPYDATLNQISYMSCPMPAKSGRKDAVDLNNPFYNVRAGSYDNSTYATTFGATGFSTPELNHRLRHGIGLSQKFLDYVNNTFKHSEPSFLKAKMIAHPAVQNLNPVLALINADRSHDTGGLGFDYGLGKGFTPMVGSLSSDTMGNYVANLPLSSGYGSVKQSFFSAYDPSQRAMVGSLSWGQNEIDRDNFLTQLNSNLVLTLGYMDTTTYLDLRGLASPDGDNVKTVYGKGYQMTFGTQSTEGLVALKSTMLKGIQEFNMETKPMSDISTAESAQWECFSLRIARKIDTLHPCTHLPLQLADCGGKTICPNYACTAGGLPTGTVVNGVKVVCPRQTIASLNDTSAGYQKNMLRLQMARRMLPAEFWDINTDPNYMCAVPTDSATSLGQCYASGDADSSKYIQYNLNDPVSGGCGAQSNANECPAYVSICYRKQ